MNCQDQQKKVALVSIFSEGTKGVPPLGPLYLATALKKNGFAVKIIHKSEKQMAQIKSEIDDFGPDLVGMSVFTGYLNGKYVQLSRQLKEKGLWIVWGNAHPSLLPAQVLEEPSVDFVVFGEGEETIVELIKNLGEPEKYLAIKGLAFKDRAGRVVVNEKRGYINLDDYPIDWSLIDLEDYIVPYFSNKYLRTLAVTTSRGCPFNCQFCYNLVFNNRRWRCHSAEKVVENLKPIINKYRLNGIRFLDDNFFVDKKRAFKIVRGLGLPYFADSRVEFVDENFVKNLKETKCQEIMFGFESGSERILKDVVQKGTGLKEIINAVKLLNNSGIMASGSMVFGFPSETREEYRQTMKFIVQLLEINNNLAFTCGWFLPYPGTGLYEKAKTLGFIPPQKIEGWDRFDRWSNEYEMEWLDWDYKKMVKYSRKIIQLLALSYKRKIPFAKQIFRWRVEHLCFSLPVDIYFFSKLRNVYMYYSGKNIFLNFAKKLMIKILRGKN